MKSFLEIMHEATSADDLVATPPLPGGVYELEITKADPNAVLRFEFGDFPEGTPCLEIYFRPVAPVEVDESELEEVEDWKSKVVSLRCVGADDMVRFVDTRTKRGLVYDAGLDAADYFADGSFDIEQCCKDLKSKHVLGTIVQSPNKKDPERPYANLRGTSPVE